MGTSNSAVFIQETVDKAVAFEFRSRSTPDNAGSCQASASAEEGKVKVEEDTESERLELSKMSGNEVDEKEGKDEGEEENDGFRTPTSPEHKIPVIQECPPAPRKPKRKASFGSCCARIDIEDMEWLFCRVDQSGKNKKARKMIDFR